MFDVPELQTVAQSVVETPPPVRVPEPEPLDTGDSIFVVFWRPFPLPGSPNNGNWDILTGTVIAVGGKYICYEISNPSLPPNFGGTWDAPANGSPLRFITPDRVFRTLEEANTATAVLKPQS